MRATVSVVVPFAGGADEARRAIAALDAIARRPGDQLLAVDNSVEGALVAIAGEAAAAGIEVLEARGVRSAFFARNAGAGRARGEWILFCDADVVPPADLLDRLLEPAPGAGVGIVAGELRGDPGQEALAARWARSRRGAIAAHHLELGPWPAGVSANLLVRRETFEELGGFALVRSDADVELCWRAQEAGWGFAYRAGALALHRDPETLRGLAAQAAGYGAGRRWTLGRDRAAGPRPRLLRPLLRAGAGALAWTARGEPERAAFKLLDGVSAAAAWAGYAARSNSPAPAGGAAPGALRGRASGGGSSPAAT